MTDLRVGLTLTADGSGLVGEVRIAREEVERLSEEARKTGDEFSQAGGEVGKAGDEFRKTGGEVRKTGDEARKIGGEIRKTGGAAQQAAVGANQYRGAITKMAKGVAGAAGATNRFRGSLAATSPSLAKLAQGIGGAESASQKMARSLKAAGEAAARSRARMDKFRRSLRRTRDAGRRLRSEFIGLKAAVGGLAFGALIRQATQTALAYERIDLSLAAATGSMMSGRVEMEFVRSEAERLGLALQPVSLQYSRLAAAAIGTRLQGQGVRDIFLGVAEAAGALSLSATQTDGLFQAVEQTMSRGVVSAEEVRRQMGNALPGAFNIAADAMGATLAEFNKMLERGEVLSEDFLPKFAAALRDRFGDAAIEAADGATSSFNRFQNALEEAQLEFANSGFLDSVTGSLNEIRDTLGDESIKENLRDLGATIGSTFKFLVENADTLIAIGTLYLGAKAGLAVVGPNAPLPIRLAAAAISISAATIAVATSSSVSEGSAYYTQRHGGNRLLRINRFDGTGSVSIAPRAGENLIGRLEYDRFTAEGGLQLLDRQFRLDDGVPAVLRGGDSGRVPRTGEEREELDNQIRTIVERERGLLPDNERLKAELDEWRDNLRSAITEAGGSWAKYEQRVDSLVNAELAAHYEADAERARESLVERERALLTPLERGEIQLREWADEVRAAVEAAGGNWGEYAARVNNVISSELAELYEEDAERQKQAAAEIREAYLDRLRASDQFTDGVRLGWEEMRDSAETYSESIGNVFRDTVTGMEDAIANFITTGKLSFADFARSVANDLLRIGIRQAITQPLFNSFFGDAGGAPAGVGPQGGILADAGRNPGFFSSVGNSFRNLFSSGTNHGGGLAGGGSIRRDVPLLAFAGAERYHAGGVVGGLAYNEVPAILKRGEEVVRRDDPRHILNNSGTVRVEIVNRGQPQAVESAQFRNDGGRERVLSIVLTDIDNNGPLAQRLGSLFGERGDF